MPYAALSHGKLDDLDYHAERPFLSWYKPDLLKGIEEWLAIDPPRLELATLALEELRTRGPRHASAGRKIFLRAKTEPIPWLISARNRVLEELPKSTTPRGRGRLYVVLRDGYTAQNGHYGAYIGVTSKRVEERFLEHRKGIRAARGLQAHGIELLYSLFAWGNPIPGGGLVRRERETELHDILAQAIPITTGDRKEE